MRFRLALAPVLFSARHTIAGEPLTGCYKKVALRLWHGINEDGTAEVIGIILSLLYRESYVSFGVPVVPCHKNRFSRGPGWQVVERPGADLLPDCYS